MLVEVVGWEVLPGADLPATEAEPPGGKGRWWLAASRILALEPLDAGGPEGPRALLSVEWAGGVSEPTLRRFVVLGEAAAIARSLEEHAARKARAGGGT